MDGVKVVELVCLYHQFFSETGSDDIKKFASWASKNAAISPTEEQSMSEKDLNAFVLDMFNRISKFQRLYNKNFFQDFNVKTLEEFLFLKTIFKLNNPAKSEVYTENVVELTTGTKIMKRLVDLNMVKELEDNLDKRIKRVKLSAKGKKELDEINKRFHNIDDEKLGYIAKEQKETLIEILNNINQYHSEIYNRNPENYGKGNYDIL